jgi:hypothetical protein
MQLILIEKPTSEIISLEETKNYIRIDHDFDDTLILGLIKTTREAIESIIQKSIMKQVWEYTLNSNSICNFDFGESDYPSIFCDIIRIPLPKPPVTKVFKVEINDHEIEKDSYTLDAVNNKFCLCFSSKKLLNRKNKISIKIKYEAGIAENVENIPYQLKLANLMLVANAYQERFSYKQNGIISQGVKQLLGPFLNLRIF